MLFMYFINDQYYGESNFCETKIWQHLIQEDHVIHFEY